MILNSQPDNQAVLSNVSSISEFSIKVSAKAFAVLSSGIYSDKQRAIVRELSCNALDSHVAAGKRDEPFEVHIPTKLEPWFLVRDYGIGLSHEEVMTIYTGYFESTKTESNDMVGAFGLGSKSPFCYTDNFTVTAIKDGTKGIYTAFINEGGKPSIVCLASMPTEEANGVEVKFAVQKESDFNLFAESARRVFKYFDVLPKINIQVSNERNLKNLEDDVFVCSGFSSSSYALMGNIQYPLDAEIFPQYKNLLSKGSLEIRFDIGDLDIQPSREHLSYNDLTKESILRKIDRLVGNKIAEVEQKLINCKNDYEVTLVLRNSLSINSVLYEAAVKKYIDSRKQPWFTQMMKNGYIQTEVDIFPDHLEKSCNAVIIPIIKEGYKFSIKGKKQRWVNGKTENYVSLSMTNEPIIVEVDEKRTPKNKIRDYYNENTPKTRQVFIISKSDPTKDVDWDKLFEEFIPEPDSSSIIKSSTIPRKPPAPRQSLAKERLSVYTGSWHKGESFEKVNDPTRDFYYVPLKGYIVQSSRANSLSTSSLYTYAREILDIGKIYGVRGEMIDEIKKQPNWHNAEDALIEASAKLVGNPELKSLVALKESSEYSIFNYSGLVLLSKTERENLSKSFYTDFWDIYHKVSEVDQFAYQNAEVVCKHFGISTAVVGVVDLVKEFNNLVDICKSRYPMLSKYNVIKKALPDDEIRRYVEIVEYWYQSGQQF